MARRRVPRGLTLLELMLALTITALVAGALSAMVHAVTVATTSRGDTRATLIGGTTATERLAAYIRPSQCILEVSRDGFVLWLEDDRNGNTVHATEVRWFTHDPDTGDLTVAWVAFPDEWADPMKDLNDSEFPADSDWSLVRTKYATAGYLETLLIADRLVAFSLEVPTVDPIDATYATISCDFEGLTGVTSVRSVLAIEQHEAPDL